VNLLMRALNQHRSMPLPHFILESLQIQDPGKPGSPNQIRIDTDAGMLPAGLLGIPGEAGSMSIS